MPSGFPLHSRDRPCRGGVPNTCLAGVQTNTCNCPQLLCQQIVDCTRTAGRSHCVHIVQKGENVLSWPQTTLSWIARQNRSGIKGSPCSPPSTWWNTQTRGSDVGRSNEWQETSEAWDTVQLFHHGAAEHVVVRAYPIYGQCRGLCIRISHQPYSMSDTIRTSSR